MPVAQPIKITGQRPKPARLNITDWKGGYNSFLDSVRKNKNSLEESLNIMLAQDGVPRKRPGTAVFGDPLVGQIDGDGTFSHYDFNAKRLVEYNIAVCDGVIYTAKSAANWHAAEGMTLTTGNPCSFLSIDNKVVIGNGVDRMIMYDIETNTASQITPIATPAVPTLTRSADLAAGTITIRYQITAINAAGETTGSGVASITVDKQRGTWQNTTGSAAKSQNITVNWPKVPGAVRYNIYCSDSPDQTYYVDSIGDSGAAETSYIDEASTTGLKDVIPPADNTTGGPIMSELSYSDNRLFGCGDPNHPYRVYWGGLGENTTAFAGFYGGGWVDIAKGGDLIPVKVKSYRDGKGEPINTVFMTDVAGLGEQYQITLTTVTAGTSTSIVPMLARVIASYGTPAAGSVVEATNNLFYLNKYAVSTTGAKPDMLNALVTDEVSLAIRDIIQKINSAYIDQVQAISFHGKIYFAIPYGETANNIVAILDLELKNWVLPWTLAVGKWIIYTGEDGEERLLYRPSKMVKDRSYLIEISDDFDTDLGVPFPVKISTPIIQFDPSHFQFERVQKVYFEMLKAIGDIDIMIYGSMKNRDIQLLRSFRITSKTNNAGMGFDHEFFDESFVDEMKGTIGAITKETYNKKVMKVRKTLNNIRIVIETNSLADWMLSVVSIVGVPKKVSDPSRWKR